MRLRLYRKMNRIRHLEKRIEELERNSIEDQLIFGSIGRSVDMLLQASKNHTDAIMDIHRALTFSNN